MLKDYGEVRLVSMGPGYRLLLPTDEMRLRALSAILEGHQVRIRNSGANGYKDCDEWPYYVWVARRENGDFLADEDFEFARSVAELLGRPQAPQDHGLDEAGTIDPAHTLSRSVQPQASEHLVPQALDAALLPRLDGMTDRLHEIANLVESASIATQNRLNSIFDRLASQIEGLAAGEIRERVEAAIQGDRQAAEQLYDNALAKEKEGETLRSELASRQAEIANLELHRDHLNKLLEEKTYELANADTGERSGTPRIADGSFGL